MTNTLSNARFDFIFGILQQFQSMGAGPEDLYLEYLDLRAMSYQKLYEDFHFYCIGD